MFKTLIILLLKQICKDTCMHILVRFLNECNTDEKNVKNNGECKSTQQNKVSINFFFKLITGQMKRVVREI